MTSSVKYEIILEIFNRCFFLIFLTPIPCLTYCVKQTNFFFFPTGLPLD